MNIQTASAPPTIWQRSSLCRFSRWLFSWRILRRLVIVLLWTITLVALLYGIENWRGRRAWTLYRQQLESQGEQLDLHAFIPKPVAEEQNFASTPLVRSWFVRGSAGELVHALNGIDDYERLQQKVGASGRNRSRDNRQFIDLEGWEMGFNALRTGSVGPGQRFDSGHTDSASRGKAAPAVLTGLSAIEPALEELRQASRRPACRYPVTYDLDNPWGILLPHLPAINAICRRLELRACAQLAAGRSGQALADVKLTFYLLDSVADEPFLIAFLVRLAGQPLAIQPIWEGLADHRWSDSQLQELQRYLQQLDFLADLKRPLDTERAAAILTADLIRKKGLGLLVALSSGAPVSDRALANFVGTFVPSGWYFREQLVYCQLYDQGLSGMSDLRARRIFPRQIQANTSAVEATLTDRHKAHQDVLQHRVLAQLLLPALGKVHLKAAMAQVAIDQAALACALERCRLATGQFPEKLEALQPRFINTLPTDPCNGQSYRYQRNADGQFVLYSVGWNETDDGGFPGQTLFDEKQGDWVWEYPKR
jgi:hypothetical protein